jgi:hypothetical protein
MKTTILAAMVALLPLQALSQTTYGSVTTLNSNVGSRVTIQLQSNTASVFAGNFAQTFSYQNGTTNFTRNFNFAGNTNFNVTSTINTNSFTWTNNPSIKWYQSNTSE